MEKECVTYQQALAVKALGFDEPCFGYFLEDGTWTPSSYSYEGTEYPNNSTWYYVTSPTYSQVFTWFLDVHKLHSFIDIYPTKEEPNRCWFMIRYLERERDEEDYMSGWCASNDKAKSGSIDKLISIVKEKNGIL